jgi:hypothetical protein
MEQYKSAMRTKSVLAFSTFMMALAIFLFSCAKEDPAVMQPDYPQFVGTWEGTTTQSLPISIGIMNLNGLLVVNTYKYSVVKVDSGGSSSRTKAYDVSSSTIVTSVVNKYFKFTPYDPLGSNDYLNGRFNDTTMVLTGQFTATFPKLSGTGSDIIYGSYTATKVR